MMKFSEKEREIEERYVELSEKERFLREIFRSVQRRESYCVRLSQIMIEKGG